jgi:hypothetical protein
MNMQELIGLNTLKNSGGIKAPNVVAESYLLKDCKTGVELEFEGCVISEADAVAMSHAGWAGKPDGSLREGGYEWIIRYPLANNALRDTVYFALDLAKKRNYQVSVRTGLHTHVNVMDMMFEQYKMLLLIYAFIEPAIYHYASNDRDENVHCLPWFATSDGLMTVSDVYNSPEEYVRRALDNVERYGGLNIAATRRFGSVEWRHMKATLEPIKIMDWVAINHRVKEAAIRLAGNRDLIADASTNPQGALEQILQGEAKLLWYNGIVPDCAKLGVRSMLDIVNRGAPKYNPSADWDAAQFTMERSVAMQRFLDKPRIKAPQVEYLEPPVVPRVGVGAQRDFARPDWGRIMNQVNMDAAEAQLRRDADARMINQLVEGPGQVGNLWVADDQAVAEALQPQQNLRLRLAALQWGQAPVPEPEIREEDVEDGDEDFIDLFDGDVGDREARDRQ